MIAERISLVPRQDGGHLPSLRVDGCMVTLSMCQYAYFNIYLADGTLHVNRANTSHIRPCMRILSYPGSTTRRAIGQIGAAASRRYTGLRFVWQPLDKEFVRGEQLQTA